MNSGWDSAGEIAAAVSRGTASAREVVAASLARIERSRVLNAFTSVVGERALARAEAIDQAPKNGRALGPLAGVPFAVKNLFDVAGIPTVAGSKINRAYPPAAHDAPLIARLEEAGAILVGALNMGEYAYDFTGENIHDGPSRNPHDTARMTGGSSGGSGGAVAGGLVPLALGSDTNGSIRVPASLCGIFGLKPTYGRLSRAGYVSVCGEPRSSWTVGAHEQGPRARLRRDAGVRPARPGLCRSARPNRPARRSIGASMACGSRLPADTSATAPSRRRALRWSASPPRSTSWTRSSFRKRRRARGAAYMITAAEGAALHLDRLRKQAREFDPAVRDRLIAGALVPAALVAKAQKFRRWYRERMLELFANVDAILAPATPCTAPLIGQQTFVLDGVELSVRANLGIYTQPISFIGLPVVAVPIPLKPLPIGVQIIAAPWREDVALRIAHALETKGVAVGAKTGGRHGGFGQEMQIDLPDVLAEVRDAFDEYEQALVSTTSRRSMRSSMTIRARSAMAAAKISMAMARSRRFGAARSPAGLMRTTVENRHHDLRARLRSRLDVVSPRQH